VAPPTLSAEPPLIVRAEPAPVAPVPAPPPIAPAPEPIEPPELITTRTGGIRLKLIPPGAFLMGSDKADDPEAEDDEQPRHRVRITRSFYLGATEVTQGQFRAVMMDQNPSLFGGSDDRPVENVSWLDAIAFCNALSFAEGLPLFYLFDGANVAVIDWNGPGYRLPSEAEWEYACRAGNPARYSFGDDPTGLDACVWYGGNSSNQTHPVGQKRPNGFGLFDMHGNVYEWCWDGYKANYYRESPDADPSGPSGAAVHVLRGGAWADEPRICRAAKRGWGTPLYHISGLGFRLARAGVQSGSR
jgi:formylglycine-generating enzyme required for sulfatase activity